MVERNTVRSSIKNLFSKRSCLLFPRPVDDEEVLQEGMELVDSTQIKPEFMEQVVKLRAKMLSAQPKQLFGALLSGRNLVDLAKVDGKAYYDC